MSTPVVMLIVIALYVLSCVRAWHRITRPHRSELKHLHTASPSPLPSGPLRPEAK